MDFQTFGWIVLGIVLVAGFLAFVLPMLYLIAYVLIRWAWDLFAEFVLYRVHRQK